MIKKETRPDWRDMNNTIKMIYLRNRRRDIEHGQETKPKNKEDLENKKQKEQKFNPRK